MVLLRVLQSDNGCEFDNHLIASVMREWPGKAEIVHAGRPRHPQSHGLVERGNRTIEAKLACKFAKTGTGAWSEWLPTMQC